LIFQAQRYHRGCTADFPPGRRFLGSNRQTRRTPRHTLRAVDKVVRKLDAAAPTALALPLDLSRIPDIFPAIIPTQRVLLLN
jgi:hypothetical protein